MSWPLLPPSYERQLGHARRVELADDRRIRERNKVNYRLSHWPIWIFVFFIAPGPLTFDLFNRGFDRRTLLWLGLVVVGTGIAGLFGKLPGVEPRPYIIRFTTGGSVTPSRGARRSRSRCSTSPALRPRR